MFRATILILTLLPAAAISQTAAHATLDSITLPTYEEGLPDPNPPFDQFQSVSNLAYVYPYTMRINFTTKKSNQSWRAVKLENEYLRCIILPDLGGHVYTCLDKVIGRDMFYANSSIKKQWVGLRGAWVALGLESNFPNGHTWVSVSPVDFTYQDNPDGSASVFVGNIDQVTGMQWRCEFVLRPGVGVLEQHVTLENRSNVRRRYYFWSNAGVKLLSNQDRFIVPTNLASIHGSGFIDTWPVGVAGKDWSVVGTYPSGEGYFAVGSHEEYMAFYQPGTKSGLLHVASPKDVPGKKTWTWGADTWPNINLSEDGSTYVEIQGGATESQEVYYYLEPQQIRTFQENWMPIRFLGGVSKANTIAAVNLARMSTGILAEILVTRKLENAKLQLWQGDQMLRQAAGNYAPDQLASITMTAVDSTPVTFRLLDSKGVLLLEKVEGQLDAATSDDYTVGQRVDPGWLANPASDSDYGLRADYNERLANYDWAANDYAAGLLKYPGSQELKNGSGRLFEILSNPDAAAPFLDPATTDVELQYYGALARQDAAGLASLQEDPVYGLSASMRLAQMLAAGGDQDGALTALRVALTPQSRAIRAGAMEIALLRSLGRMEEAAARLAYWTVIDPTDSALRYEAVKQGQDDSDALNSHLASDPQRILNIAEHLMGLGLFADALDVLSASYDSPDALILEPGVPGPSKHPLIWYYRGYCKEKTGQSGVAEYRTAAGLSVQFIFPNRPVSLDVLTAALRTSPDDPTALWLRGCVLLSVRRTNDAIADWARVRTLKPATPSLHRSLGRAWLDVKHDKVTALPILQEGLKYEPNNSDLNNAYQRAK